MAAWMALTMAASFDADAAADADAVDVGAGFPGLAAELGSALTVTESMPTKIAESGFTRVLREGTHKLNNRVILSQSQRFWGFPADLSQLGEHYTRARVILSYT